MRCLHQRREGRAALRLIAAAALTAAAALLATPTPAAIVWDGEAGTNWWFNPVNWNTNSNDNVQLPPSTPISGADAQLNAGTGVWDVTGEGVVYDPANDPHFAAASSLVFPTGSTMVSTPGVNRDYGPETIYRLYVSRNTTNHNLLTIKSGDLVIESTTIIGRSGSSVGNQNEGRVVQTGGSVRLPTIALDLGQREASGWGNGVWDYRGGVLEVSLVGGNGLRLSAGGGAGAGGTGRFIMRNPASGGYVRTFVLNVAANGGPGGFGNSANPDGVNTGVGILEFHFENGGIPQNLGLIDVNFGGIFNGTITGTGDLTGDNVFNNDRVFSDITGTTHYREGDMVSATFGSTKYNWTISYTGDIIWTDANNSVVNQVTGPMTGTDVVLLGHSIETIAVDNADFNGDGRVDGADFLIWQRGLGVGTTLAAGDANGDGAVNAADLTIWRN
ncbi:MAG TPA: dockerin type I repeat-containing protein [Lacipirellulaceae bacterium]|nr:dockerin type I repeat-containing protein [Lacipirellulaceae bacterium]